MALTADQLQARIDSLRASRDAGVLIVRHGDEQVTYRSLEEMDKILARLQGELDALNGTVPRSKVNYLTQTSKGTDGLPTGTFDDWS